MNATGSTHQPLTWPKAIFFILAAVVCFHLAYAGEYFVFIFCYVICLAQLSRLPRMRQAYYGGLITAFLCVAPQLTCFWKIFGPGSVALWYVLAFWIGMFVALTQALRARLGLKFAVMLLPFLWTGLEYFRSELYYLKFSWMNPGYAFAGDWVPLHFLGIYGVGFLVAICAALSLTRRKLAYAGIGGIVLLCVSLRSPNKAVPGPATIRIAGVQMEFPVQLEIPLALDALYAEHPDADLFVLSEYSLDGPVPKVLQTWCRKHGRYLVVGGKDPAPNNNYYNTAFVVGPTGDIVFRQVKSVPIQFFKDGLPAPKQEIWESPWGKIGFCVCYDLSYTRVTDRLVKMGAQLIVVPTMDVVDWGLRQHQLHALVAPVRATEYGVPIFRLASSGISQAVDSRGRTLATAPFAGEGAHLYAQLELPPRGGVPLDRLLAQASVGVTGVVVVILFIKYRKQKRQRRIAN